MGHCTFIWKPSSVTSTPKALAYLREIVITHKLRQFNWWKVLCAGVDDLFVHTMAVNKGALRFYAEHGFAVVAEESPNEAHYR